MEKEKMPDVVNNESEDIEKLSAEELRERTIALNAIKKSIDTANISNKLDKEGGDLQTQRIRSKFRNREINSSKDSKKESTENKEEGSERLYR